MASEGVIFPIPEVNTFTSFEVYPVLSSCVCKQSWVGFPWSSPLATYPLLGTLL